MEAARQRGRAPRAYMKRHRSSAQKDRPVPGRGKGCGRNSTQPRRRQGGGTGTIFDDNGAALGRTPTSANPQSKFPSWWRDRELWARLTGCCKAMSRSSIEMDVDVKFTGDHEHGFDTVAEIPGTDPKLKDEVVMVGGHLDSWIAGTGATDNGAGTVVAMEVDAHPERAGSQAAAHHPHRPLDRRRAGPLRLQGLRKAALRCVAALHRARSGACRNSCASPPARSKSSRSRNSSPATSTWTTARAKFAASIPRATRHRAHLRAMDGPAQGSRRNHAHQCATPAARTTSVLRRGRHPGLPVHPGHLDYESRTHHSNEDVYERLQPPT